MTTAKPNSRKRSALLALASVSALLSGGCTDALFDAAAAGALDFVQSGVMTTLANTVFGDNEMGTDSVAMDGMDTSSDGDHDSHGG